MKFFIILVNLFVAINNVLTNPISQNPTTINAITPTVFAEPPLKNITPRILRDQTDPAGVDPYSHPVQSHHIIGRYKHTY
ncbi:hypothetical protein Glove_364g25 [Diversispora epigaea]|uniref:Uncharacterized protein n=1 Tax=Diversispora epigaea TaxID=1348612 RepID=A0A397H8J1_9GLOM|nr:hypothetical protein Glove_364g25 [Diversispora epigaea]